MANESCGNMTTHPAHPWEKSISTKDRNGNPINTTVTKQCPGR